MYNVATNKQPGLGTSLADCGCLSSTNLTGKYKHTGSMRQLGQMKRQKSSRKSDGDLETPPVLRRGSSFEVDPSKWETATNWSGGAPEGFAHELHHLMAFSLDRYDYIESHTGNQYMKIPSRLY